MIFLDDQVNISCFSQVSVDLEILLTIQRLFWFTLKISVKILQQIYIYIYIYFFTILKYLLLTKKCKLSIR